MPTNCTLTIGATGGPIRIEGRFRLEAPAGTLSATILRDGVNLNGTEPIWIDISSGGALQTKTSFLLWVDTPSAGSHTYDLVMWEATVGFTVQNASTPCLLVAMEVTSP